MLHLRTSRWAPVCNSMKRCSLALLKGYCCKTSCFDHMNECVKTKSWWQSPGLKNLSDRHAHLILKSPGAHDFIANDVRESSLAEEGTGDDWRTHQHSELLSILSSARKTSLLLAQHTPSTWQQQHLHSQLFSHVSL